MSDLQAQLKAALERISELENNLYFAENARDTFKSRWEKEAACRQKREAELQESQACAVRLRNALKRANQQMMKQHTELANYRQTLGLNKKGDAVSRPRKSVGEG